MSFLLTTHSPPSTRNTHTHARIDLTRYSPPSPRAHTHTHPHTHTHTHPQHYESAFELDPTNTSFLLNMAAAYFEMANYEMC